MNSNQAIAILADLLQFSFTRLTLANLENNNYTNDYSNEILLEFTISRHLPFNIKIGNGSCFLLPEEYKHLVCENSTANGNCLFNSASIVLYGGEGYCMQFRLAVIIELMKNTGKYLEIDAFETDITYLDDALNSVESLKKTEFE
nr:10520_t:CDS:1 [Entrophospora candida]